MRMHPDLLVIATVLTVPAHTSCFQQPRPQRQSRSYGTCRTATTSDENGRHHQLTQRRSGLLAKPSMATTTTTTALFDRRKTEYSRELMLREEAENPFRKVRFFFYASLGAGALVSLLVSVTRIAAALSGINTDLLSESSTNAAVDVGGLVVLGLLWQNDIKAEQSRLQRASKGAELAKLKVRVSKSLMFVDDDDATSSAIGVTTTAGTTTDVAVTGASSSSSSSSFVTSLASLRRGRGIDKRVVIAAAGRERIVAVLDEAVELAESLTMNDLLVVPVVLPSIALPIDVIDNERLLLLAECVAMPVVSASGWSIVIDDEVRRAIEQGIDVDREGLFVILKKNGRVGQRTRGIYLRNLVGEVTRRRDAGMDVVNI